jgi:hypothetical protein
MKIYNLKPLKISNICNNSGFITIATIRKTKNAITRFLFLDFSSGVKVGIVLLQKNATNPHIIDIIRNKIDQVLRL